MVTGRLSTPGCPGIPPSLAGIFNLVFSRSPAPLTPPCFKVTPCAFFTVRSKLVVSDVRAAPYFFAGSRPLPIPPLPFVFFGTPGVSGLFHASLSWATDFYFFSFRAYVPFVVFSTTFYLRLLAMVLIIISLGPNRIVYFFCFVLVF